MIPQLNLSRSGRVLGGVKLLYQRSGIVARSVTMVSAMLSAYSTTPQLQSFLGSFSVFLLVVGAGLVGWMLFDYAVILPNEMGFTQRQAHGSAERSPLKSDTEEILREIRDSDSKSNTGDDK